MTDSLPSFRNVLVARHQTARDWKAKGKHVIGWSCSYTPEEVIHAAGALPVFVFGDIETPRLADIHLPTNSCSFARGCLNSALKGDYSYLDGFVASSSCDNRNKIFDFWRCKTDLQYLHFVNTPSRRTQKAHEFFHEENLRFKQSLEKFLQVTISKEALRKAIKAYNENRAHLKEVYELRREDPPLITGVEALEIVLSSMLLPKEKHNEMLTHFLTEVPNRRVRPKKGVRLLASGSIVDNVELLEIVESVGGSVVADDWCIGSRYFWNPVVSNGDPLQAIAKRYLDKIPSSFMFDEKRRFEHTIRMAKKFNVQGAVIFNQKFCDTHLFDAPQLLEDLKAIGLPALTIEWEQSLSGVAQIKTRIEAFIEMIGGVA